MARQRTLNIEDRRKDIVDATVSILSQKGYHDVRLDEVAEKAGVAKGTLYLYFRDKETLFSEVMRNVVERLESQISALPPAGDAVSHLREIARVETSFLAHYRDFLAQFSFRKPLGISPVATRTLKQWFTGHLDFLGGVLERGMREGKIRRYNTREGALFFVAICRMCALHIEGAEAAGDRQAERIMSLFLDGMRARA